MFGKTEDFKMAGQPTANVDLYTTNMQTDGEDYFDFERDLDNNWEKLDKRFGVQTITLLANGWTGVAAPYSQTVNITGIAAKHNPHISLKASSDYDTAQNELKEYSKLFKGETGAGTITFWANEQTVIDIELNLKIL